MNGHPTLIAPGLWRADSASHGVYYSRSLTMAIAWTIDPGNPVFHGGAMTTEKPADGAAAIAGR